MLALTQGAPSRGAYQTSGPHLGAALCPPASTYTGEEKEVSWGGLNRLVTWMGTMDAEKAFGHEHGNLQHTGPHECGLCCIDAAQTAHLCCLQYACISMSSGIDSYECIAHALHLWHPLRSRRWPLVISLPSNQLAGVLSSAWLGWANCSVSRLDLSGNQLTVILTQVRILLGVLFRYGWVEAWSARGRWWGGGG
jgi:hypothetical protein